jgi:hypothetical protein
MKTFKNALLVFAFALAAISCEEDEKDIPETDLPQEARNFIELHFPGTTIKRIVRDNERSIDYDIWLQNGFFLEFNEAGNWVEIDGKGAAIPVAIINELPDALTTYLSENYAADTVISLDLDGGVYEVELSTGLELIFDTNGTFVRLED